jgi:hypothetical protein
MSAETSAMAQPYDMESVRRAKPPSGAEGADWHRYVITQGANRIYGFRKGNLQDVTSAVTEIVFQLNQRRLGKRGRVHLVIAPKK